MRVGPRALFECRAQYPNGDYASFEMKLLIIIFSYLASTRYVTHSSSLTNAQPGPRKTDPGSNTK